MLLPVFSNTFSFAILVLSHLAASQNTSAPTAKVLNGTLFGFHNPTYNEDIFLGIPYSQPPVGDLRFRQAQPLNTSWEGLKNATNYSPECIGYGSDTWVLGNIISEDCLTLNVIKPAGVSPGAGLPVAVWIHGGGLTNGGSRDPRYNLSFIVEQSTLSRAPMIGVSINYRLHAWGFLFGEEVAAAGSDNIGFRDQRLALHWIQENIAAFGGDPTKVTIWGQSAGAGSVGVQLVAYGGRDDGLFRGGIMESGSPISSRRYLNATQWEPFYTNITNAVNCTSSTDSLACLRTVPVDVLSSVFNSSVTTGATWGPQIDGDFIRESSSAALPAGRFLKVPILIGGNFDEGTMFGKMGVNTDAEFLADVKSAGPDDATASIIEALYPDIPEIGIPATENGRPPNGTSFGFEWKRAAAYGGDLTIHANRRFVAQTWAAQNVTAWSYHFNVFGNGISSEIGATHFQEVVFVFDNTNGLGYETVVAVNPLANEPPTFDKLARLMSRTWVSFVNDLDPNNSGVSCVVWPKYTLDNPQNIVHNVNVTNLAYIEPDIYRANGIAFLNANMETVFGR